MSRWDEIRPAFARFVFSRKVVDVAASIPAAPQSVYNWANGTHRPNRAAEARIREIVNDEHANR